MALSKKYCEAFNNAAMSPMKHKENSKNPNSRRNSDSD